MKAVRLLQIIIVLAAGAYLWLLHDLNEVNVFLPFLFSLSPAVVVLLALLIGWLLGWLPTAVRGAQKNREIRKLNRRIAELEKWDPDAAIHEDGTPIIPDRRPTESPVQQPFDAQDRYDEHENI